MGRPYILWKWLEIVVLEDLRVAVGLQSLKVHVRTESIAVVSYFDGSLHFWYTGGNDEYYRWCWGSSEGGKASNAFKKMRSRERS